MLEEKGKLGPWGPFLERPGNLTGPKSHFEIKVFRKVGCVLTSNEVHFVSLADNFTVQFSNLLKLPSGMENKELNRPGNYRELRETGPRRHMWVEFVVGSLPCSERFFSGYSGFLLSSKTNISKFQFDLDYCQALNHEPLARVMAQAVPVFDIKFTITFFLQMCIST